MARKLEIAFRSCQASGVLEGDTRVCHAGVLLFFLNKSFFGHAFYSRNSLRPLGDTLRHKVDINWMRKTEREEKQSKKIGGGARMDRVDKPLKYTPRPECSPGGSCTRSPAPPEGQLLVFGSPRSPPANVFLKHTDLTWPWLWGGGGAGNRVPNEVLGR